MDPRARRVEGPAFSPATEAGPANLPGLGALPFTARSGLAYRLFVSRTPAPPPDGGYPVLYVLDGNAVAGIVHDVLRSQSVDQGGLMGPGLVVAVGYPGDAPLHMDRRARDYTPVPATPGRGAFTYLSPDATGGADAFLDVLTAEVMPEIAARYPVNPRLQGLMGHSFGGLFTLHALRTRPAAFSAYLAASPSLWWADRALPRAPLDLPPLETPRRVLITVGEHEQSLHPALRQRPDAEATRQRLAERNMVEEARAFSARLSSLPGRPADVTLLELAGETHSSAAPVALLKGLAYFFGSSS